MRLLLSVRIGTDKSQKIYLPCVHCLLHRFAVSETRFTLFDLCEFRLRQGGSGRAKNASKQVFSVL